LWRGEWTAAPGKYSRPHLWVLAGAKLKASDSSALLPAAYRDKVAINPHNMFVATISSAHMLTWLHIAFGMYDDRAHSRTRPAALLHRPLDEDEGDSAQCVNGNDSAWCNRAQVQPRIVMGK
jgi:hypothetical protein